MYYRKVTLCVNVLIIEIDIQSKFINTTKRFYQPICITRDSTKHRPLGVTIIAIINIIGGIFFILGGLAPVAFAAFAPELSIVLTVIGGILIAIGIASFIVSYGLLKGKGWAWSVTLILSYNWNSNRYYLDCRR
jgi:hypothetical protein